MQRYFTEEDSGTFSLSRDDSCHILKVMRLKKDDLVEVVSKQKLYICKIINSDNNIVTVRKVEEVKQDSELDCQVTIVQSLVKEQKMDFILQKCCELGVSKIIPLNTKRSIVKLDSKETKKIERWNKILKEASEQSKRVVIPTVSNICNIEDLVKEDYDIKILCTVNELSNDIKKVLSKDLNGARIVIVIGPEGGFEKEEEQTLIDNGYVPTSLGKRVLRTETASLYALSIINYITMR